MRTYADALEGNIRPALGDYSDDALTSQDVQRWIDSSIHRGWTTNVKDEDGEVTKQHRCVRMELDRSLIWMPMPRRRRGEDTRSHRWRSFLRPAICQKIAPPMSAGTYGRRSRAPEDGEKLGRSAGLVFGVPGGSAVPSSACHGNTRSDGSQSSRKGRRCSASMSRSTISQA